MKYLVTTEMMEERVPGDPRQLVQHVEQVIGRHEAMVQLVKEKKVLAGGGAVGQKMDGFIVDVASNKELNDLLMSLPLHHVMQVEVIPLADYEDLVTKERQNVERLQAAPK